MKYIECPYCGAHLDHGEICDCRKANKAALQSQDGLAREIETCREDTDCTYYTPGSAETQIERGGDNGAA